MDLNLCKEEIDDSAEFYLNGENSHLVIAYNNQFRGPVVHAVGFDGDIEVTKNALIANPAVVIIDVVDLSKDYEPQRDLIMEEIKKVANQ